METLTLKTTVTFNEPIAKVWRGITVPALVKKYFFGTDLKSDFKKGSRITFNGEWEGKTYVDGGIILEINAPQLLKYNYWSSMAGTEDKPENYADVTYQLAESNGVTTLTITQDNVKNQQALEHSEQNWHMIFDGLKELLKTIS
ncbi:uncharacterized protein YndB with AHSA1/START domain [Mucilaginibacter frigoritolerans]|uniref:Uncharacterized protein YndB with AHSA1/START domain n=1 Tax=Mucilaginibacter frigoritolerans TaxID=652788 RepID=A0A562TVC5_9SPHI|nr:SRPBCC family protein [Mucilaginibacter frigoritolerans]TWI96760.1 uncharacterized protein YndB with AHSA1/START domain [Mucilaginibacter frigoritolerans]